MKETIGRCVTIHERLLENLHRIFNRVPEAHCLINFDTSPRSAVNAPSYSLPSSDGRVPGMFNPPLGGSRYTSISLDRIVAHEGPIGHHQQLGLQQELDRRSVPALLRSCVPALTFVEGYAMYAEGLFQDMGIREGLLQVARRLKSYLHALRMSRLDLGMNGHEPWSKEAARAKQNEMFDDSPPEILRALAWPGQANAYYVGRREHERVSRLPEVALCNKFNLPGYQDVVLGGGAMGFGALEERVQAWVDSH